MSTKIGRDAEEAAATYLRGQDFEILQQNYRTRWCEIDIVAHKSQVVYFIECKYRSKSNWGGGLEYITQAKLKQMHFAAEFWLGQYITRQLASNNNFAAKLALGRL